MQGLLREAEGRLEEDLQVPDREETKPLDRFGEEVRPQRYLQGQVPEGARRPQGRKACEHLNASSELAVEEVKESTHVQIFHQTI